MTTTFTWTPDYGATANRKPRIKSIAFGDGYEQRYEDGINTLPQVWNLTFSDRVYTDIDDIEDFFSALNGTDWFYWTPPRSSTQGKYVCKEWQRQISIGTYDTLTAMFTEVFDNA